MQQEHGMGHSMVYGQWLGWMMAAIYMGGRIPQIWLNVSPNCVSWVYFVWQLLQLSLSYAFFFSLVVLIHILWYWGICLFFWGSETCLLFYQIKRGSVEVWPCKNF